MVLKLYGLSASQPFRAVAWVLEMKNIPFEKVFTLPGGKKDSPLGSRSSTYKKLVPAGTVPALEDTDANLTLFESNAILCYIGDKFNLEDLYPRDAVKRALIHQWLHWHHSNSRIFTIALFAPILRPDIKFTEEDLKAKRAQVTNVAKLMDSHLANSAFLCGSSPTIADIACYEDIGQCKPEYCDLFDFSQFQHLSRWMGEIEKLPKFADSHKVLYKLREAIKNSKL